MLTLKISKKDIQVSKVININRLEIELGVSISMQISNSTITNAISIKYIDTKGDEVVSQIHKPNWFNDDYMDRKVRVVKIRIGTQLYRLLPINVKEETA